MIAEETEASRYDKIDGMHKKSLQKDAALYPLFPSVSFLYKRIICSRG